MDQPEIVARGRCEVWVDALAGETVAITGLINEVVTLGRKFITILKIEEVRAPDGAPVPYNSALYKSLHSEGMKHIDASTVRMLRVIDSPDALAATLPPKEEEGAESPE